MGGSKRTAISESR